MQASAQMSSSIAVPWSSAARANWKVLGRWRFAKTILQFFHFISVAQAKMLRRLQWKNSKRVIATRLVEGWKIKDSNSHEHGSSSSSSSGISALYRWVCSSSSSSITSYLYFAKREEKFHKMICTCFVWRPILVVVNVTSQACWYGDEHSGYVQRC